MIFLIILNNTNIYFLMHSKLKLSKKIIIYLFIFEMVLDREIKNKIRK